MKRIIAILLICLLALCACGENQQEPAENLVAPPTLDYLSAWENTASVAEDEAYIFYAKADGIYRLAKDGSEDKRIYEAEDPDDLFVTDDRVYFTLKDYATVEKYKEYNGELADKSINAVDKNGKGFKAIFDSTVAKQNNCEEMDFTNIGDYFVEGDILISANMMSFSFMIDIKNGSFEMLQDDMEIVNSFAINDGKFYYIPHAPRKLTLFSYDIDTKAVEIVCGDGVVVEDGEPEKDFYCKDFCIIDDVIYVFGWDSAMGGHGIFKLTENGLELICKNEGYVVQNYGDSIYFQEVENGILNIYEYDVKTNTQKTAATVEDYKQGEIWCVVNGYVYYAPIEKSAVKTALIEE